jgi:D-alanyl-D-alanine carboxypeptidase
MIRYRIWMFALGCIIPCPAIAQTDQVDAYIKTEMEKRHVPAISVAVVKDGKVALAKGYGFANVELGVPATADTVYEIGSITKQFTSTAVMILVEEGKMGLDEKMRKYLPDTPEAWDGVTIRHLLTHTSGIKSYTGIPDFPKMLREETSKEDVIRKVASIPLEFKPGEKFNYNNTGYFLLGMVIEKVTGKSYGDFLAERIFKPLGMTSTRVNDMNEIIKNRAAGYSYRGGALHNCEFASMSWPFAAGVLVSTVNDMAKWDAALYTERLVKKSSLEQMWTPYKLNDGKPTGYGFGWGIVDKGGHRGVAHGGGINGFTTNIARLYDVKITVIVLSNMDGHNPGAMGDKIAKIYVPALAAASEEPVADTDKKTTEMLKRVLLRIASGNNDPPELTEEFRKFLTPERLQAGAEFVKGNGPLKSLDLLSVKPEDKRKAYRYLATFGDSKVIATFFVTNDGKVAGLGMQPE